MAFEITEIARGLGFIEGPVAREDGSLLFTDIGRGHILRRDADGSIDLFADVGGGPNGLADAGDGTVLVCNNGGLGFTVSPEGYQRPDGSAGTQPLTPSIQRVGTDGQVDTVVAAHANGPLLAPNDLVVDGHGGYYFTDFGEVKGRVLDPGGVYYAPVTDSETLATELIHSASPTTPLIRPNGIALAPDGETLYVAETPTGRVWSWAVAEPGVLTAGARPTTANGATLVYSLDEYAFFDSMGVDPAGNIWVATVRKGGISVVAPDGERLAFIDMPLFDPAVTNVCFSPDGDVAYVTAAGTGRLYAITGSL